MSTNKGRLRALATPDKSPWWDRVYREKGRDPRGGYERDRDRILHCDSFRKLQHKTQVFVVHEGDFFRTRLTHSLEVAQIGRSLARVLGLTEPLVEAICLAHDLGHTPFGHAGERELDTLLRKQNLEWNSNAHSLKVVEELEIQYPEHSGLNLTWATREGLARHSTRYDDAGGGGDYERYRQPSPEAQVANVADLIAYSTHDVEDALEARLLDVQDMGDKGVGVWAVNRQKAVREFQKAHPGGAWHGVDKEGLLIKRTRRHMIDHLIRDVAAESARRVEKWHPSSVEQARDLAEPLLAFSGKTGAEVEALLDFMMEKVYQGEVVARQTHRAAHMVRELFTAFVGNDLLLPLSVRQRILNGGCRELEVARFIAGLTDRGAADLYGELFHPGERAMGHRIS